MGCATNRLHQTWSAVERFERGWMYWRQDADRIYVMSSSRKWQGFADIWNEGEPVDGGLTPPPGLLEPVRGFGKIWREKLGGPGAAIGWAVEEERGADRQIQDFQRGVILIADGQLYVLFRDNGSWSQP